MSTRIDSQSGNILNAGSVNDLTVQGPAVINVTAQISLEELLSGNIASIRFKVQETPNLPSEKSSERDNSGQGKPPMSGKDRANLKAAVLVDELYKTSGNMFVAERVTNEDGELKSGMFLRPEDEPPYQKAEHPDGTVLHGLVFKLTIPEGPIAYRKDPDRPGKGISADLFEEILRASAESHKIHTCYYQGKTITGAINEEDLRWNWQWDRPETLRQLLVRYANGIFIACSDYCKAVKFRVYCAFMVGNYYIQDGIIYGETIETVTQIHKGMGRLFTPLSLDYDYDYEFETEEFRASRKRHYYTSYADKDFLDEGIVIGTTDIDFIGGYGNWYRPVIYNHYEDSKAVILYAQKEMPGKPVKYRVRLKRFLHRIKESIQDKYYAFKYRNVFKELEDD